MMEKDVEKVSGLRGRTTRSNNGNKKGEASTSRYMPLPDISPSSSPGGTVYNLRSRPKRKMGKSTKDLKKHRRSDPKTKKGPIREKKRETKSTQYLPLPEISSASLSEHFSEDHQSLPKRLKTMKEIPHTTTKTEIPHTTTKTKNCDIEVKERETKNTKYMSLPNIIPPPSEEDAFDNHQSPSKRTLGKSIRDLKKIPNSSPKTKIDFLEEKEREANNTKRVLLRDVSLLPSDEDAFDDRQSPSKRKLGKSIRDLKKMSNSSPKTKKDSLEEGKEREANNTKNILPPDASLPPSDEDAFDDCQSPSKRKMGKSIRDLKKIPNSSPKTKKDFLEGKERETNNTKSILPPDVSLPPSDEDAFDDRQSPSKRTLGKSIRDLKKIPNSSKTKKDSLEEGKEREANNIKSILLPDVSLPPSDEDTFDDRQSPSKRKLVKSIRDLKKIPNFAPEANEDVIEEKESEANNTENMVFLDVSLPLSDDNDIDDSQSPPKRKREKCTEDRKRNPCSVHKTTRCHSDVERREVANVNLVAQDMSVLSPVRDKSGNLSLPNRKRKYTRKDTEEISNSVGNTEGITVDGKEMEVRAKTAKLMFLHIPKISLYDSDTDESSDDMNVNQFVRKMERFKKEVLDKESNESLVDGDTNRDTSMEEVLSDSVDGSLFGIDIDHLVSEIEKFRKDVCDGGSDESSIGSCTDHETSIGEVSREDCGGSLDDRNIDLLLRELERNKNEEEEEERKKSVVRKLEHFILKIENLLPVLKQELKLMKESS